MTLRGYLPTFTNLSNQVDRRREARKIVSARGEFEAYRLKRLRKLSVAVKSLRYLDPDVKQTATSTLQTLVRDSTPPSYPAGYLDLARALGIDIEPTRLGEEDEVEDEFDGELQQEDVLKLLRRTGVPVTASGELEDEVLSPLRLPHIRELSSKLSTVSSPKDIPVSEPAALTVQDTSQDEGVSNIVREDTPPKIPSKDHSTPGGDVVSTITNLYMEYRQSTTHLDSLPRTVPTQIVESSSDVTDPSEARTDYVMSKSQHHLTAEEGAFWLALSQSAAGEDAEQASDTLALKSSILSESYERRTHPPTSQTYEECKEIIRAMGVPCLEADGSYEAEALASSMVLHGQADYVASEDTVRNHHTSFPNIGLSGSRTYWYTELLWSAMYPRVPTPWSSSLAKEYARLWT